MSLAGKGVKTPFPLDQTHIILIFSYVLKDGHILF